MLSGYASKLLRRAIKTNAFRDVAEALGMKSRELTFNYKHRPKKVQKALERLNREQKREIFGQFTAPDYDYTETHNLSSSWILWGEFQRNKGKHNGTLTLKLKGGRQYKYFNVPQTTWVQMKNAKGRNGTGAGSVFWKYYLRRYMKAKGKFQMGILFEIKGIRPKRRK